MSLQQRQQRSLAASNLHIAVSFTNDLTDHQGASSHREAQSAELTPATYTNGLGCHDLLSDTRELSPQVSDRLGHLCGIF